MTSWSFASADLYIAEQTFSYTSEVKNKMIASPADRPRRHDANSLFAAFARLFKAVPDDKLDDILDGIPGDVDSSRWNDNKRPASAGVIGVSGKNESASGEGVELRNGHSEVVASSGAADLAASLGKMLSETLEKAVKEVLRDAVEDAFSATGRPMKGGKPNVAPGPVSEPGDEEPTEDDDSDEEQIEKALSGLSLKQINVADLMNVVRGRGLSTPPDFMKFAMKAVTPDAHAELMDGLTFEQRVKLQESRQLLAAKARGVAVNRDAVQKAMDTIRNPRAAVMSEHVAADIAAQNRLAAFGGKGMHVGTPEGRDGVRLPRR